MPVPFIILIALYLVMLVVLLTVAYTPNLFCHYTLCKGILSCLFVAAALLACYYRHPVVFWPIVLAFGAAAVGDICIGIANNRYGDRASHSMVGLAGVGCFAVAHLFYTLWFLRECRFVWYQQLILPVVAVLLMLKLTRSSQFDFGKRRPTGVIYYAVMATMFSAGMNVALRGNSASGLNGILVGCGVTLFLISDVLMLFLYFYTGHRAKSLRFWNLSTYYIGQLLIALSIFA